MPRKGTIDFVEPVYAELGGRIRWLREQKGWTAIALAKALGLHPSAISTWERGITRVRLSELVRIAHLIGVTLEVFLADLDIEACQPSAALSAARKKRSNSRQQAYRKKKGREK